MKIGVIGTGYVGLITGVCLAEVGHDVMCCDIDPLKVEKLSSGEPTIHEKGLADMLKSNIHANRLHFTTEMSALATFAEVIFLAVGTPQSQSGEANLTYLFAAVDDLIAHANKDCILVIKSTVPVGTNQQVIEKIRAAKLEYSVHVVSNPEFLKEGFAIEDCMQPERIVLGGDKEAMPTMQAVYAHWVDKRVPLIQTTLATAELIKYASNAFLATKIAFIGEIANLSDAVGADVSAVAEAMGLDSRISPKFLRAGCGFGGSCFPKDVSALAKQFEEANTHSDLLPAVLSSNDRQKYIVLDKLTVLYSDLRHKTIAVWGLAFKPGTDDVREATSITVIKQLLEAGAVVKAYDPEAKSTFAVELQHERLTIVDTAEVACDGADALLVLTEWPEFQQLDMAACLDSMKAKVVIDGRNCLNGTDIISASGQYYSVGRDVLYEDVK